MRRIAVPPRPDWQDRARALGFHFAHIDGQTYWDESGCFIFSLEEVERDLEGPTQELHAMCLDLADEACRNESILDCLGVPEPFRDYVVTSWRQQDPTIFGRFDLAYNGTGPAKLLEYNADTPTALYEAAYFQWVWMKEAQELGLIAQSADQFNSIQEHLIRAYDRLPKRSILHFTGYGNDIEDSGTLQYMTDCAAQAGHKVKFVDITAIGCDPRDRFTDQDDLVIETLSNLYPWEWFFEDPFGPKIPRSGTRMIEPAWKALLSTKAILPLLWERHPGHPNLLESYFTTDQRAAALSDFVRKPLLSREGANVTLVRSGTAVAIADGPYGGGREVAQAAADLFRSDSGYAVIGSWVVGTEACGIGVREDHSAITSNLSRFLPHIILD